MNQQTMMAAATTRPNPIAAANPAWLHEEAANQRNPVAICGGGEMRAQAPMAGNIEKILSLTRLSWAAAYPNKQLPGSKRR